MLKIKDNVDLKELEKFGLKPRYDTYTGKIIEYVYVWQPDNANIITISFRDGSSYMGKIEMGRLSVDFKYELLYDLIQAGLVEKVEE